MVKKLEKTEAEAINENERVLTVRISNLARDPEFIFTGNWAGKDVRIILRHITMAYRRHQIAASKAMVVKQKQPELIGATNE